MLILGLDSAGNGCSVCLWQDGKVLALRSESMARGQDARLLPLVRETLAEARVQMDQLDRIVATRGPGSFTGIRIGLAAAHGLSLALDRPVLGVDRFSLYDKQNPSDGRPLLICLESKRREIFTAFRDEQGRLQQPGMQTEEEITLQKQALPSLLLTGDATERGFPLLPLKEAEIVTAAALAAEAALENPDFAATPLYLRAPDVTLKRSL